ncbi:MAG: radical SAM protein [Deltaproteobacteria bacterium]|nr:radical SAM protein [Deltaproteobacteria bacterium]
MKVQTKVKQIAAIQIAKAILKVLPRLSEKRILEISLVRKGLEAVSYYPEGRDFLKNLLLHGRRAIGRSSRECLAKFAENLIVNGFITATPRREEFKSRYGFHPPFFLVISPTMRCNLNCYGCYAGDYDKSAELDTDLIHRLLQEAKEMGIYFITVSGGEPFIREDLLDIFAAHSDVYFQVYTNGTLIDERMAKALSRVGNVLPAISVEGWEKATDARRGPGSFQKVLAAMGWLRQAGVLFGFSATAIRQNNELICSDEFVKFWIDRGCFIGWYFNYLPIGKKPDLDLMPTPEQRIYRRKRLIEIRLNLPIILADFWNDGPLVGGCIAGDRYLHITANGAVEPCVFVHFAVDNIKEKSLAEILNSQFFHSIRQRQPYSANYYRPCMVIDHPHILREVIGQSGAHPTHPGAEAILTQFAGDLDRYALAYGKLADTLWSEQRPDSAPLERRPYGELKGIAK